MSPVMMNWSSGCGGSLRKRSLNSFARFEALELELVSSDETSDVYFQEFWMAQSWSSRSSRCLEARDDVPRSRCRRDEEDGNDNDWKPAVAIDDGDVKAEASGIAIAIAIAIETTTIAGSGNGADTDDVRRNFMMLASCVVLWILACNVAVFCCRLENPKEVRK